jgi:hypothetical protein
MSRPLSTPSPATKAMGVARLGHFCLPGEQQVREVCVPLAPLASKQARCSFMPPRGGVPLLCQPALEFGGALAQPVEGQPNDSMSHGHPLLGFSVVVAPISEASRPRKQVPPHPPVSRDVCGLLGEQVPPHKVAPPLHRIIRGVLQGRKVSPEGVSSYLSLLGDLRRYDGAFAHLWSKFVSSDLDPTSASLGEVAGLLLQLHSESPSQARHAYAAMLLIPGFEQLRFSPLLRQVKRLWNSSQPKYATFWNAMPLVQRLSGQPLGTSLESIRNRLILSWRFFQLSRSIDLARTFRKVSMVGDVPFIWVQRKGWPRPRWEEVVCLPSCPELCPWALLKLYVSKSSALPAGSLLLRGLRPPFAPLTSNSIGSLTRRMLHLLGLPPGAWGPHSTRGAGVLMYKTLGLSSEEVCEIGKWKNTGAFSSHYLRLGAPQQAGRRLERFVHSVSSGEGAEPDKSRTPRNHGDLGGRDLEGEAPSPDETYYFVAG